MKTQITRVELKKIHDIACDRWAKKIADYAKANPFSDTIDFSEKQIEEMIKACTAEQLPIVKDVFNVVDTFESIKTVEDACKYLGEIDDEVRQLRLLQNIPNLNRRTLSGQELVVITKALNEGVILDWDNHNEYKYIPWWYLGKDFRLDYVSEFDTTSIVCAPLHTKSRELADYSAKQFKSIWKDCLN